MKKTHSHSISVHSNRNKVLRQKYARVPNESPHWQHRALVSLQRPHALGGGNDGGDGGGGAEGDCVGGGGGHGRRFGGGPDGGGNEARGTAARGDRGSKTAARATSGGRWRWQRRRRDAGEMAAVE